MEHRREDAIEIGAEILLICEEPFRRYLAAEVQRKPSNRLVRLFDELHHQLIELLR